MHVRKATINDCDDIARLAMIAGENIPGYFWDGSRIGQESLESAGSRKAANSESNFSYRNVRVAETNSKTIGMLLSYALPWEPVSTLDILQLPEFVRPLVELENQARGSYYINMLAVYSTHRGLGSGSRLLSMVDEFARDSNCSRVSIQVFSHNHGAINLYQRTGFIVVDKKPVADNDYLPAKTHSLLMIREIKTQ